MNKPSLAREWTFVLTWKFFFEIYIFSKAKATKFRIVVSSSGAADQNRVRTHFHLYVNYLPLCTDHQKRLRCSKLWGKNSETSFIPILWSVCTQPLTEKSTRSISWGWRRPMRKADNLTTILNFLEPSEPLRGSGSSVSIATDYGLEIWDRIPVGTRFSARPDRPWDPPSLL
jgi:hypothetical protein